MDRPLGCIQCGLVIYAKDMDRVARFYAAVLDLESVADDSGFIVLAKPSFELSVVRIPERIAAGIDIASPPELREDTALKPSFLVPSLQAVRAAACAAGGQLEPGGFGVALPRIRPPRRLGP